MKIYQIIMTTVLSVSMINCSSKNIFNKSRKDSKNKKSTKIKIKNIEETEFQDFMLNIKQSNSIIKKQKQLQKQISNQNKKFKYKVKGKDPKSLYQEAFEAHLKNDYYKLLSVETVLNTKYKQSIYSDKVLFLKAKMEYDRGKLLNALKTTNNIIKNFPLSSKRAPALLLKSEIYKDLGLKSQQGLSLKEINVQYPKSKEYYFIKLNEQGRSNEKNNI